MVTRRVRVSDRNQRVTFYRPTISSQNSSGEDVVTNVSLGSAWVRIRPLSGREREQAQQLMAHAEFEIYAEHPLSGYTLQSKDIAEWGDRTLDLYVPEDPTGKRRNIFLYAKEYVS